MIQDFGTDKVEHIRKVIIHSFEVLRNWMEEIKDEEVTIVLFFNKNDTLFLILFE